MFQKWCVVLCPHVSVVTQYSSEHTGFSSFVLFVKWFYFSSLCVCISCLNGKKFSPGWIIWAFLLSCLCCRRNGEHSDVSNWSLFQSSQLLHVCWVSFFICRAALCKSWISVTSDLHGFSSVSKIRLSVAHLSIDKLFVCVMRHSFWQEECCSSLLSLQVTALGILDWMFLSQISQCVWLWGQWYH